MHDGIIINLVLVILASSSNKEQNLVTFASSRGASTSSKTYRRWIYEKNCENKR